MGVRGFVVVSSDVPSCDSWPTRSAGGLATRTAADAFGCPAGGDAAALEQVPYQATRVRRWWRGAVLWWNARSRSTTARP